MVDLNELLALLDIDSPQEFAYFEQFADLMEAPQDIPAETLASLIEGADQGSLIDLIEGYFEELAAAVPDGEDELYTLLGNIGTTLKSLAYNNEDDGIAVFADELYKFRTWYLSESCVLCTNIDEGTEKEIPLIEALAEYRAQALTDEEFVFDFSGSLDFPLEEYIVSLGAIIEDDYGDGDTYGEDEDYRDPEEDE